MILLNKQFENGFTNNFNVDEEVLKVIDCTINGEKIVLGDLLSKVTNLREGYINGMQYNLQTKR